VKIGWFVISWSYAIEVILAALVYIVLAYLCGVGMLSEFVKETGSAWANMTGVLFAASLTIWVAFINITTTDFGGYLRFKGVYGLYSTAFVFAMFTFFLVTGLLITATASWMHIAVRNATLGILIFSAINVVTLVRNATGLVRAHAVFREEAAKVQNERSDSAHGKITKKSRASRD
jgi:hypothetical protein